MERGIRNVEITKLLEAKVEEVKERIEDKRNLRMEKMMKSEREEKEKVESEIWNL